MRRFHLDPGFALASTYFIDSQNPMLRETVQDLLSDETNTRSRAEILFNYVRDAITFETLPCTNASELVASATLKRGSGTSVQKAVLLAALARAAGIPTALIFADLKDHTLPSSVRESLGTDVLAFHGLVAFNIEGDWRLADPSHSPELRMRNGFWPVQFDGTDDALIRETTLTGERHAEYLHFHGIFADLPLDRMREHLAEVYGNTATTTRHLIDTERESLSKG